MPGWLDALAALERDGTPSVLVTVLAARGSTPREAGCKMVVTAAEAHGTIGGGNLEFQSLARARELLREAPAAPVVAEFPLGPALGQCCGGHVTVLFEVLRPPRLQIALFGAGHVGQALITLLADLPCRVSWIDPRPEALPASVPPNVTPVRTAQPALTIASLPPGSLILVMTHDHQLDFEIVSAALQRPDLPAVGLIGSNTKRARFLSRLARMGIESETLICPIGLPGIEGKEPAVVAISVAAQILQLRPQSSPRSAAPMPRTERSCGDCVCPPVITQEPR